MPFCGTCTRKGNNVTLQRVNCRIPELGLRSVCRELVQTNRTLSHRDLRQVLRERFGATGKTARVLKVWREELERAASPSTVDAHRPSGPALPSDVIELQARLLQSETRCAYLQKRVELAEVREQIHQDRWAVEIDRFRQQLRAQPDYAQEVRTLQSTVTRLTAEISALRGGLAAS